jgi:hypothetical protein
VVFGDAFAVEVAEDGFEDDADAHRQLRDWPDAGRLELRQRVEPPGLAIAEVEGGEGVEGVVRH